MLKRPDFVPVQLRNKTLQKTQTLPFQGLGLLPGEFLVCEMTILGSTAVDGVGEVQLLDNHTRSEVKVVANNLDQLITALGAGTITLDKYAERLSNTNSV